MGTRVSPTDVEFLERLRGLVSARQSTMPVATTVRGRSAEKQMDQTQREIRASWDFDGSILLGRVDTTDGQRYYIGTRAVATAADGTLVHARDSDVGRRLWSGTSAQDPGPAVLKRTLVVTFWTLVESTTEFDLRGEVEAARPPADTRARARPARHSGRVLDLDGLRALRDAALSALAAVVAAVEAGEQATGDAGDAVAEWNDALAATSSAQGLDPATATLASVEEAVATARRAARRAELDHKIAVLAELVDDGDLGREEIEALRRRLERMRDEADSLRE